MSSLKGLPKIGIASARSVLAETRLVPVLVGALLIFAAVAKGRDIATRELSGIGLAETRWFLAVVIALEIAAGYWLLSSYYRRQARYAAMLLFLVFAEVSLYGISVRAASCRCFGNFHLSPWLALGIDLLAIGLLWAWRPRPGVWMHSSPGKFIVACFLLLVGQVLAFTAVQDHAPTGVNPSLRSVAELNKRIDVQMAASGLSDLLGRMSECGLSFQIDPRLHGHRLIAEDNFGYVQTRRAKVWALMEMISDRSTVPIRWQPKPGGYIIVPAAGTGVLLPWVVIVASAVTILLTSLEGTFLRKHQTC